MLLNFDAHRAPASKPRQAPSATTPVTASMAAV